MTTPTASAAREFFGCGPMDDLHALQCASGKDGFLCLALARLIEEERASEREECAKVAEDHECGAIECKGMATRIAASIREG